MSNFIEISETHQMMPPYQVCIVPHPEFGVCIVVREHDRGSIAIHDEITELFGGQLEADEDGYTIRCREEKPIFEIARKIAEHSSQ